MKCFGGRRKARAIANFAKSKNLNRSFPGIAMSETTGAGLTRATNSNAWSAFATFMDYL